MSMWAVAAVASLCAGVIVSGIATANGEIAGLYHDDGIYALTAKAIAAGDGYRLINLPTAPPATKYPPLYPALLSLVWLVSPEFPANLPALKGVNAVLLALLVPVLYAWAGRLGLAVPERLLACALAGFSPGLFWFSDILLSEPLFILLAVCLFLIVENRQPWTMRRAFLAGIIAGLAVLTRVPGVALAIAAGVVVLKVGGRRSFSVYLVALLALVAPWWVWRTVAMSSAVGPLEAYYVAYEPSAWSRVAADPAYTLRVVRYNASFFAHAVPAVFGWPGAPFVAVALPVSAIGIWRLRQTNTVILGSLWVFTTVAGLLAHPYPMARYLTPFVPLMTVLVAAGTAALRDLFEQSDRRAVSWRRTLPLLPLLMLLAVNVAWLNHYRQTTTSAIHGEFGRALPFSWAEFAATFRWIRENTPHDARLAAAHDVFYALNTGREAVRPWLHRPEQYTQPYGTDSLEPPDLPVVLAGFEKLSVCFLVVDPLLQGGEGEWGRRHLSALLRSVERRWRVAFEASAAGPAVLVSMAPACL